MKKAKNHVIRIYNNSKQMIPLQVRPPGGDFFTNESQIRISPGKDVQLPKSHLRQDQIGNLSKRGMIKITYDSEAIAEREEALANQ